MRYKRRPEGGWHVQIKHDGAWAFVGRVVGDAAVQWRAYDLDNAIVKASAATEYFETRGVAAETLIARTHGVSVLLDVTEGK